MKDPRASGDGIVTDSHQGIKIQKLQWAGMGKILTTGWADSSEREYKIYDVRSMDQPLVSKRLDGEKYQMIPYFDYDTGVLYIMNKGTDFTQFYHYNRATDEVTYMDKYKSNGIQQALAFIPKTDLDFKANEIGRAVRFN